MANADSSVKTGHSGHWTATATQAGVYEFHTGGTFVDRDIDLEVPAAIVTKGTTTVGSTKISGNYPVTRGTFDIAAGFISDSEGDLDAATFANSATPGVTYVDISETTSSPVLKTGDYLYINQGYADNLKISLAKLVPDGASGASAIKAGMLQSVSAYDNDGNLVTGDIVAKSQTDVTVSGKTVTVPAGYYASQVSKSVADGSLGALSLTAKDDAVTVGTTATSGYYPVNIGSISGTVTVNTGYISGDKTVTDSDGVKVGKIAQSTSKVGSTAKASGSTIDQGSKLTISAGYYPSDREFTAQSFPASQNITGTLSTSIDTGYTAPTLVDTKASGTPYITISGNGTMTAGNRYSGTATAKVQYLEVFAGSYEVK